MKPATKQPRVGSYFFSFAWSTATALTWGLSFLVVYVAHPVLGTTSWWQTLVGTLASCSPLASGYRAKSDFPELSFQYFAVMQPASLLILSVGWWPVARRQDYSPIVRRYCEGGVGLRVASWALIACFIAGAVAAYTLLGGQELPGTRLNSSRLSLAVFGPLAASGLAVFMALWGINVALGYRRATYLSGRT